MDIALLETGSNGPGPNSQRQGRILADAPGTPAPIQSCTTLIATPKQTNDRAIHDSANHHCKICMPGL
jgi:hypothetical protein